MRDYFTPVNFPELEEKKNEPKEVPKIKKSIKTQLKKIREEIAALQQGTSTIRDGAISFPKGKAPVLTVLKRLEDDPKNMQLLHEFIKLTNQDLGLAVARNFAALFDDIDPTLKDTLG